MQIIKKNGTDSALREVWHETKDGAKVLLLKYPLLEETGIVKHCFTTRIGGVSEGIFSTMNLSFSRGDDREAVETNYRRLAEVMDVSYENFVFTDQTHTVNVRKVTAKDAGKGIVRERDYTDIDGLITNEPGLVLSTFFADCVPLYFVDPVRKAIGLCHSGWRGTAGMIGKEVVLKMQTLFGCDPDDILAAVGPSICQNCYEVSEDVAGQFTETFGLRENDPMLLPRGGGKYLLDLWEANRRVLLRAGIREDHISVAQICTCCHPDILFSHRASQGKRGNLGAFLSLNG